ncbi:MULTISPECIES: DUF2786 domain-containing protein [Pasteurellaceae]|uniref:DUF2786 domain-containing protein n=1 Tax=Pasteurellaceae TaxID=712 RepID=UPI0020200F89|nr:MULTISPECIES: DUF2786 domain-containing protein [Pasteurellaceae]MCL7726136.1 DUF2786 domain-containing protein [Actinobacillus pleuropneumoniae]MCL7737358.1 DUF2786 domain-containing protein [Actinobacillus pleuropneumoniae]MDX3962170.1 DUF2786 domain-containing protein [Pasteurella multocida]
MSNEKLINKIKKLLALAKSPNPHEAARALEMAQKLMKKNQLSEEEIVFSEQESDVSFAQKPPSYVSYLTHVICKAFGCEAYFNSGFKSSTVFIGQEERPEIAAYCFDVLYRKLLKARKEFIATQSKRLKRSTLTARADSFCEGWVIGVRQNVTEFAMTPTEKGKLERYFTQLQAKQNMTEAKCREAGDTREANSHNSRRQGYLAGEKVKLNHGVNGKESLKLGAM